MAGPVYESMQTQREMNSLTELNMPQSVDSIDGQNSNFYQFLSDMAHYIDCPLQLQKYIYTNNASDGSDTGTPTDTPTSETMPLTAPRNNPTMVNEIAPESVAKTSAIEDADEVHTEVSHAGAQCHSLNLE